MVFSMVASPYVSFCSAYSSVPIRKKPRSSRRVAHASTRSRVRPFCRRCSPSPCAGTEACVRTGSSRRTSPGRAARATAGGRRTASGRPRPSRPPGCAPAGRSDPDVLPGRRDDEVADALEDLVDPRSASPLASRYSNPRPRRRRVSPGPEAVRSSQPGHCRLLSHEAAPPNRAPSSAASATLLHMRAIVQLDPSRASGCSVHAPGRRAARRTVRDAERLLSRTPGRFDGPIAFRHGVSPEGRSCGGRPLRGGHGRLRGADAGVPSRLRAGRPAFVERPEGAVLFQLARAVDRPGSASDGVSLRRPAPGRRSPGRRSSPTRRRRSASPRATSRTFARSPLRQRRLGLGADRLPRDPAPRGRAGPP